MGEDENIREFVISDESIDRHGTVIYADAWDLEAYKKNPTVLAMHYSGSWTEYDFDNVLGRGEVAIEDSKLVGKVKFEPRDINELAWKVMNKVDFGSINATSVGFISRAGHWGMEDRGENPDVYYYTDVELVEFSIVVTPSNKNAVKRGLITGELPAKPVIKLKRNNFKQKIQLLNI